MNIRSVMTASVATTCFAWAAAADEVAVDMHAVTPEGVGAPVGSITLSDGDQGALVAFDLKDLLPGPHRFNIHENPSCEPGEIEGTVHAAGAAGERWQGGEPPNDFPVIYVQVDEDGARPFKRTVVAPGLKAADVQGRSLVIHGHRDNYRYEPKLPDGRGPRVACGVAS